MRNTTSLTSVILIINVEVMAFQKLVANERGAGVAFLCTAAHISAFHTPDTTFMRLSAYSGFPTLCAALHSNRCTCLTSPLYTVIRSNNMVAGTPKALLWGGYTLA